MNKDQLLSNCVLLIDADTPASEEKLLFSRLFPYELNKIHWVDSPYSIEEAPLIVKKIKNSFYLIPFPLTAWIIDCRKVNPEALFNDDYCSAAIFRSINIGLVFLYETGSTIPEIIAKNIASTFHAKNILARGRRYF